MRVLCGLGGKKVMNTPLFITLQSYEQFRQADTQDLFKKRDLGNVMNSYRQVGISYEQVMNREVGIKVKI